MYYIKNGLNKNWHWLAYLFLCIRSSDCIWNGKCNTGEYNYNSNRFRIIQLWGDWSGWKAKTVNLVIGIVLAVLIALILLGGIKRIGQVTEKLVPFMAVIYVLLAPEWFC